MKPATRLFSIAMLSASLGSSGCTSSSSPDDLAHTGGGAHDGSSGSGESASGSGGGGAVTGTLGMVVIDVQEAFVSGSSTPDMPSVIDRTRSAFELAGEQGVPFFLTFEASQQGDHALHAPLVPTLPSQTEKFTKTTFAATGLPAFTEAVQTAELSHVVVLGAETDVCVLQTVLGLRALGLTVLLQGDAVFTEETNPSPAIARMRQAGVRVVDASDVAHYVADPSALPAPSSAEVRITRPLELGVVLNDFSDASLAQDTDPLAPQKSARLRELLMVSEWFELPVYSASADLPSAYRQYYGGLLRPLAQIGTDSSVTQLVIAGSDGELTEAISDWMSTHTLFLMEDALLGLDASTHASLYDEGLVPTTYKSFYYDMTKSVDESEWPSSTWVDRFDDFYWITSAPEDLPPIPASE